MKKIVWEWEMIDPTTSRVKVIGGWLIKSGVITKNSAAVDLLFIVDQHHEWYPTAPFVDPQIEKSKLAKEFVSS
jgi:hypothetical protein